MLEKAARCLNNLPLTPSSYGLYTTQYNELYYRHLRELGIPVINEEEFLKMIV